MKRNWTLKISIAFMVISFMGFFVRANENCKSEVASISEETEIELKFLVPRLALLPNDILNSLKSGSDSEKVLRRGIVVQEYLDLNSENILNFIRSLNEANIHFGRPEKQNEFLHAGKAKEIRMMSKSLKIQEKKINFYQATIKGAGGLSAEQLESPENISEEQTRNIKKIFSSFRSQVKHRIIKIYFEPLVTDSTGRTLLRKDGSPYTAEVDLILGKSGIEEPLLLINAEIEFHGSEGLHEAEKWRKNLMNRPPYFGLDLTDATDVKSRDISANGFAPESLRHILSQYSNENHEIARAIWGDFAKWVELDETLLPLWN